MTFDSQQELIKPTQNMRTDGLALEGTGQAQHRQLVDRHRKVIAPEVCQALEQTAGTVYRRREAGLHLGHINGSGVLTQPHRDGHHTALCLSGLSTQSQRAHDDLL